MRRAPRLNPMAVPSPGVAQSRRQRVDVVSKRKSVPYVEVVIVDLRQSQGPWPYALLGYGTAAHYEDWTVGTTAARAGFGPLLYDLLARAAGSPIHKSIDLSDNSLRFWARQEEDFIRPLTDAQYFTKYGSAAPPETDINDAYWFWADRVAMIAWTEEVSLDDAVDLALRYPHPGFGAVE